jgi:hypothetical protein
VPVNEFRRGTGIDLSPVTVQASLSGSVSSDMKHRTEVIAYHEAGHCVAARVLGLEIGEKGCSILEINDDSSPLDGSSDIRMEDPGYGPKDGMVTTIAGPAAGFKREIELLEQCGEFDEEALSTAFLFTAEIMVPGPGLGDAEGIVDLLNELIGYRCANTDDEIVLVAKAIALSLVGVEWGTIKSILEDSGLAVVDEWYVPLREATDQAVALVGEHWQIVHALARRLLRDKQITGLDVKALLDEAD